MIGRTKVANFIICLFTGIAVVAFGGTVLAGPSLIFVDYDGDGINDLYSDGNNNGIPDAFESTGDTSASKMTGALGNVFNTGEVAAGPSEDILSAYEGFCEREFRTRDLSNHRGGFGAGENFGPGNGIGSGALSGGCVGGVCQ